MVHVHIAHAATVVAVGGSGVIRQSTDDGGNWFIRNSGTTETLTDVECLADGNCWAVGGFFAIVVASRIDAPVSVEVQSAAEIHTSRAVPQLDRDDPAHNMMLCGWLIFINGLE